MIREIEMWRKAGWEPLGEFGMDVQDAYLAAISKTPESVVAEMLEPWRVRFGPHVVAEGMALMRQHLGVVGA